MKKTFLMFVLFAFCTLGQSQTQRTFGDIADEYAFAVKNTSDKGYIVGGYTSGFSAAQYDFYLVKTDSSGTALWGKRYGSNKRDQLFTLLQTTDGGYLLGGYSNSYMSAGGYDAMLVKTDANGDTLWARLYGGLQDDYVNTMQQTSDGGFILAGYTTPKLFGTDSGNVLLIKINSTGTLQWSRVIGAPQLYSDGYGIIQTSDKGFLITGYTDGFGEAAGDIFLFKTDSMGTVSWGKTYGHKGVDWAYNILPATNGFIIGGCYSTDSTSTDADVLLIRTDMSGDTLWTRCYGDNGYDYNQRLIATSSGGYVSVGYTSSYASNFNMDALMTRFDANGDTLFSMIYGDAGDDELNDVAEANGKGFLLAGHESSFGLGSYDFYTLKTDSAGSAGCYSQHVHPSRRFPIVTVTNVSPLQANISLQTRFTGLTVGSGLNIFDPCNPNAIANANVDTGVVVAPNPCSTSFTVSSILEIESITVRNSLGVVVATQNTKCFSDDLNVSALPCGLYTVEVRSANKRFIRKLLVNK